MRRAAKLVAGSVIRVVRARSVRGLVVLLLGGVLVTITVRAVEGQGTSDLVSQPGPLQLAAEDSGKAKSAKQGGASSGHGSTSAKPDASAGYVVPVPQGTTTYTQLDAGLQKAHPAMFAIPGPGDHCPRDLVLAFIQTPRTWGRVVLPGDIQKKLGDAEVYVMTGGGNVRGMWGVRGSRYYQLPEGVNQFAVDAGLLWSADNAAELFRVYTFFLAAYERLRIDNSGVHDRFVEISPGRVDSLVNGRLPLVPAFRVSSSRPRLGSDRGRTPTGTISMLTAVVDWGGRQEAAYVEFANVEGFLNNTLPRIWNWRGGERSWGVKLNLPHPPERRGDAGGSRRFTSRLLVVCGSGGAGHFQISGGNRVKGCTSAGILTACSVSPEQSQGCSDGRVAHLPQLSESRVGPSAVGVGTLLDISRPATSMTCRGSTNLPALDVIGS